MLQLLQTQAIKQEGFMVQNGKIFLVMTIVCIILIGIFLYIAGIDKRLTQLEKNN